MTSSILGGIVTPPSPSSSFVTFWLPPLIARGTHDKTDFATKHRMLGSWPSLMAFHNQNQTYRVFFWWKKYIYWGCNNWWLKVIIESYCRVSCHLFIHPPPPPRHHVIIRHLLADPPPPRPVMTSFMNSPLRQTKIPNTRIFIYNKDTKYTNI